MHGFLGTGATFWADLNLVIQIAMGVALLVGMALARRQHFRAHMVCQSSVMLLNLVLICVIMLPAFRRQVVTTPTGWPPGGVLCGRHAARRAWHGRRTARPVYCAARRDQSRARTAALPELQSVDAHGARPLVGCRVARGRYLCHLVPHSRSTSAAHCTRRCGATGPCACQPYHGHDYELRFSTPGADGSRWHHRGMGHRRWPPHRVGR